jgi:hypothetical protein
MSRRKNRGLIKESEVSKLMKLSGLKNLTESFIAEQFEDEEDKMDNMDMDLPEEEPAMEVGTAEFEGTPEDVEQLVSALADVLAAHTGVDIEVDGEDMGDEDLDVDLEDEEDEEEPLELDDEDEDDELEGEEEELALERIQRGREAAPGRRDGDRTLDESIGDILNKPVKKDGDKEKEEPRPPRKPRRKPRKHSDQGAGLAQVVEGEMEEEYMMEGEEEEGEKPEDNKFELPLNKPVKHDGKKKKRTSRDDRRKPRMPKAKAKAGLARKIREGEMEEASCSDPNEYKMMEESVQNEIAKKVVAMLLEKLANKE